MHKGHNLSNLQTATKTLHDTWCMHLNSQANAQECSPYNSYQGLILNEALHEFEICFEVCVNLLSYVKTYRHNPRDAACVVSKTK